MSRTSAVRGPLPFEPTATPDTGARHTGESAESPPNPIARSHHGMLAAWNPRPIGLAATGFAHGAQLRRAVRPSEKSSRAMSNGTRLPRKHGCRRHLVRGVVHAVLAFLVRRGAISARDNDPDCPESVHLTGSPKHLCVSPLPSSCSPSRLRPRPASTKTPAARRARRVFGNVPRYFRVGLCTGEPSWTCLTALLRVDGGC